MMKDTTATHSYEARVMRQRLENIDTQIDRISEKTVAIETEIVRMKAG